MNRLQFYKYAALFMVVLNLFLICTFLFLSPPRPPFNNKNAKNATELLKLNSDQNALFLKNAEEHIDKMELIEKEQKHLLNEYFNQLTDVSIQVNEDSLFNKFEQLERDKIKASFLHLQGVKAILNPDQYVYFEEFMDHVLAIVLNEVKNPPTHRRISD